MGVPCGPEPGEVRDAGQPRPAGGETIVFGSAPASASQPHGRRIRFSRQPLPPGTVLLYCTGAEMMRCRVSATYKYSISASVRHKSRHSTTASQLVLTVLKPPQAKEKWQCGTLSDWLHSLQWQSAVTTAACTSGLHARSWFRYVSEFMPVVTLEMHPALTMVSDPPMGHGKYSTVARAYTTVTSGHGKPTASVGTTGIVQ